MDVDRASGHAYRLVIRLATREVIFDRSPFPCYKQAVARVADAVRRHAREGNVVNVLLQRQTPLRPHRRNGTAQPGAATEGDANRWMTLDHWGGDVIGRILDQTGAPHPAAAEPTPEPPPPVAPRIAAPEVVAAPDRVAAETARAHQPVTASASAPAFAPPHSNGHPAPRTRPKNGQMGHRWHIALSIALAIVAWLVLAYFLAGGRIGELLGAVAASRPAVATELPFDARQSESHAPPSAKARRPDSLR